MITEEQLTALLEEAAAAFPAPEAGAEAVRQAILAEEAPPPGGVARPVAAGGPLRERTVTARRRSRRPVLLGLAGVGIAAVALAAVAISRTGGPAPSPATGPRSAAASEAFGGAALKAGAPAAAPASPPRSSTSSSGTAASGRQIVATGTMVLRLAPGQLASKVARLQSLAGSLGGYLAKSDVDEQGRALGGTVVVEVPAGRLSALTRAASELGKVQSLSTSDRDVTGQVVDLGARLEALEGARGRLEALAARAGSVSSLLSVEDEITDVQTQIEQIQGEQRTLAAQVSDASLSVRLEVTHRSTRPRSSGGFARAWHDAVGGFLAAVRGLVVASGPLLFALVAGGLLLLLAWYPGRWAWGAIRRRRL